MLLKSTIAGVAMALSFALPAFADSIEVEDAYARSSNAMAGAAFMEITNAADADDRLVAASSDIAARVELHTHQEVDGVMKMVHVEEGFVLPAGETIHLQRGGMHVMFMGLNQQFVQDEVLTVTLTFENAGDVVVEIPVDLERQDGMMMNMNNGDGEGMQHGQDNG